MDYQSRARQLVEEVLGEAKDSVFSLNNELHEAIPKADTIYDNLLIHQFGDCHTVLGGIHAQWVREMHKDPNHDVAVREQHEKAHLRHVGLMHWFPNVQTADEAQQFIDSAREANNMSRALLKPKHNA